MAEEIEHDDKINYSKDANEGPGKPRIFRDNTAIFCLSGIFNLPLNTLDGNYQESRANDETVQEAKGSLHFYGSKASFQKNVSEFVKEDNSDCTQVKILCGCMA